MNKLFLQCSSIEGEQIECRFYHLDYSPMEFGLLLVDMARHYANVLNKENTLEDIYKGFDMERRNNTTELQRIDN